MSRVRSVVLFIRRSCDLGTPLRTVAWIARTGASDVLVIIHPEMAAGELEVRRRLKHAGLSQLKTRVVFGRHSMKESLIRLGEAREGERLVVVGSKERDVPAREILDPETIELIECCSDPVLLFPFRLSEFVPWSLIVTPMSGEFRRNRALARAMDLANQLQVPMDIVHVIDPMQKHQYSAKAVGRTGDQPHHEIQPMISEFISAACPFCSESEKKVIRNFRLIHGSAILELPKILSDTSVGLIAIEWKGLFMRGHAETLKELIRKLRVPVLLIRETANQETSLRAGHRFRAN
ncbi:MAG: hypothetical protein KGQ59_03985 [Bdellovibrionales bacterium]|nr:hypothetical protein [Bdellovibrionales bacterium]